MEYTYTEVLFIIHLKFKVDAVHFKKSTSAYGPMDIKPLEGMESLEEEKVCVFKRRPLFAKGWWIKQGVQNEKKGGPAGIPSGCMEI